MPSGEAGQTAQKALVEADKGSELDKGLARKGSHAFMRISLVRVRSRSRIDIEKGTASTVGRLLPTKRGKAAEGEAKDEEEERRGPSEVRPRPPASLLGAGELEEQGHCEREVRERQ